MKKNNLVEEQKYLTKCIFQGLTLNQIAKDLNYSTSTVSNRINLLFKKYRVKSRFEFVIEIFSQIVNKNQLEINENKKQIINLRQQIIDTKEILKNIILYKNDVKKFDYWCIKAKNCLEL